MKNNFLAKLKSFFLPVPKKEIVLSQDGFIHICANKEMQIAWHSILEITVLKRDLITYDSITFIVKTSSCSFEISEEFLGFSEFSEKMEKELRIEPIDWESKVMLPAFAENRMKIFP